MFDHTQECATDTVSADSTQRTFSENQLQAAITMADTETAIALWKERDWKTYSNTRGALLTLLRSGRGKDIKKHNLQFIYFVNTHLRPRFNALMSDRQMFTSDTPEDSADNGSSWMVEHRRAPLVRTANERDANYPPCRYV